MGLALSLFICILPLLYVLTDKVLFDQIKNFQQMSYPKLRPRFFRSPLMEYANFEDGSFVNLIRLNKPYADGIEWGVYETTKSSFCSNGMFKTYDKAKQKFELMIRNGAMVSPLKERAIVLQLGIAMEIPHTAGDILNLDWLKILGDLERSRCSVHQVIALANVAFALSTIRPHFYSVIVNKAVEFSGKPLGYYMTANQIEILENINGFYSPKPNEG